MKKVVFLLSHIPNPRMLKRIKALENDFIISVIYWDRCLSSKEDFSINEKHKIEKIVIPAPMGEPIKRIIPWIKFFKNAIKILKKDSPDILHVNNMDMLAIALAYKRKRNSNVRIVYEVADLPKFTFINNIRSMQDVVSKLFQKIESYMVQDISKLILTSPYFWDEYYSKFLEEKKYLFVPNAPYKSLFENYNKSINDKFTIGFIGSVRFSEQIKLLIDTVDKMPEEIKIFIAGNGPEYEGIKKYAENRSHIEIYGPYNYEEEIVGLYEKIDCVYSVYDTKKDNIKIALPNRLYEAIVCGLPIIVAKNTALGNFVEEKKIGFSVNDDKNDLEEKLRLLYSDRQLKEKIYRQCISIRDNYYFENITSKLTDEYLNLVQ